MCTIQITEFEKKNTEIKRENTPLYIIAEAENVKKKKNIIAAIASKRTSKHRVVLNISTIETKVITK